MDKNIFLDTNKRSLSSRLHLTGSIQSLREATHRSSKNQLSASNTSLNSEQLPKSEISDKPNKSSMYPTWSSG